MVLFFRTDIEILSQRLGSIALLSSENFIPWSCKYEITTTISPFRTNIDYSICISDNIEVMLDDEDAISFFDQPVEYVEEFLNIRKVQSCSRLIENIESLSCRSFGEIERELDALRLSTRECRGRLSESDISESDIYEHI